MSNAPAPPPAVPRHIGIIMDGNGRWAAQRGLPREVGHRAGARTVRRITEAAARLGLRQLTLYAFRGSKAPQADRAVPQHYCTHVVVGGSSIGWPQRGIIY